MNSVLYELHVLAPRTDVMYTVTVSSTVVFWKSRCINIWYLFLCLFVGVLGSLFVCLFVCLDDHFIKGTPHNGIGLNANSQSLPSNIGLMSMILNCTNQGSVILYLSR